MLSYAMFFFYQDHKLFWNISCLYCIFGIIGPSVAGSKHMLLLMKNTGRSCTRPTAVLCIKAEGFLPRRSNLIVEPHTWETFTNHLPPVSPIICSCGAASTSCVRCQVLFTFLPAVNITCSPAESGLNVVLHG